MVQKLHLLSDDERYKDVANIPHNGIDDTRRGLKVNFKGKCSRKLWDEDILAMISEYVINYAKGFKIISSVDPQLSGYSIWIS